MTRQGFINRLSSRRAVSHRYSKADLAGAINIWFHADAFVLIWEECEDGDQANKGDYTRKERHQFFGVDTIIGLLENAGIELECFTP